MIVRNLARCAFVIPAGALMLAGCGAVNTVSSLSAAGPTSVRTHPKGGYSLLFSFTGANGKYPEAGVINLNGTLYGTTYYGGPNSLGAVFAISSSGGENVVYGFNGIPDGALPGAGLVSVNGTLFGTSNGGAKDYGAVFKLTPSGDETVIHSFTGGKDGSFPVADLVDVNATLYGTTLHGGNDGCRSHYVTSGCGTVFAIGPSGGETVLHRFAGGSKDGEYPEAGLANLNGMLYGTTPDGGGIGCEDTQGCGTVFAIAPSGKETILHRFGRPGDGADPQASLLNVDGVLYGTTHGGGHSDFGTVFKIDASGSESVVYSFEGRRKNDGAEPVAALAYSDGTFYGTTESGGSDCSDARGCGTVFSLTPSGGETVLYEFKDHNKDGAFPRGGVTEIGDTLYGTTYSGGADGYGTVFALPL
jgi:uncharacterized repeat protein (TIGR03803 family)